MKFLLVAYVLMWFGVGFWAFKHSYDVDNDGNWKSNWRWIVWFVLVLGTAPVAKLIGLF